MNSTDASPEQIAAGAAAESSQVACPYIGLKPFSEKERFPSSGERPMPKGSSIRSSLLG